MIVIVHDDDNNDDNEKDEGDKHDDEDFNDGKQEACKIEEATWKITRPNTRHKMRLAGVWEKALRT